MISCLCLPACHSAGVHSAGVHVLGSTYQGPHAGIHSASVHVPGSMCQGPRAGIHSAGVHVPGSTCQDPRARVHVPGSTCRGPQCRRPQCWGRGRALHKEPTLCFPVWMTTLFSLDLVTVLFFQLVFYVVLHTQPRALPVVSIFCPCSWAHQVPSGPPPGAGLPRALAGPSLAWSPSLPGIVLQPPFCVGSPLFWVLCHPLRLFW